MKYLISVTETYRVDSETEANNLIAEAKKEGNLNRYTCRHKEKISKGEVVDDYYKVILDKIFTSEKEPDAQVNITYTSGEVSPF